MVLAASAITRLVELWGRLPEPESQDLVRALRLARQLEGDPDLPSALLGLGWRLVEAEHEAAGWEVPPGTPFPRSEKAADTARRGWPPLLEVILSEVRNAPSEVVIVGAPAASRVLFQAWDLLPADGLELVLLGATGPSEAADSIAGQPVRIRPAGDLSDLFEAYSNPADLEGSPVRLPTAPLLAALAAEGAHSMTGVDTMVFVAAADRAANEHRWSTVEQIAERLGAGYAPRLAAARLGLEDRLGVERKGIARLTHAVKRLGWALAHHLGRDG